MDIEHTASIDRLAMFREGVGITDVFSSGPKSWKRITPNLGVYKRVVLAEKHAKIQYYSFAWLINTCLLLQIIFAAILTALGAANGSHIAITAIGAANTVIAGLLSFTKGQGLPNRLRQYQNTLRKVREYIEQPEREFAQFDCQLDLSHEIKAVIAMYEDARKNDEANDPNAYHNALDLSAKPQSVPTQTINHQSKNGRHGDIPNTGGWPLSNEETKEAGFHHASSKPDDVSSSFNANFAQGKYLLDHEGIKSALALIDFLVLSLKLESLSAAPLPDVGFTFSPRSKTSITSKSESPSPDRTISDLNDYDSGDKPLQGASQMPPKQSKENELLTLPMYAHKARKHLPFQYPPIGSFRPPRWNSKKKPARGVKNIREGGAGALTPQAKKAQCASPPPSCHTRSGAIAEDEGFTLAKRRRLQSQLNKFEWPKAICATDSTGSITRSMRKSHIAAISNMKLNYSPPISPKSTPKSLDIPQESGNPEVKDQKQSTVAASSCPRRQSSGKTRAANSELKPEDQSPPALNLSDIPLHVLPAQAMSSTDGSSSGDNLSSWTRIHGEERNLRSRISTITEDDMGHLQRDFKKVGRKRQARRSGMS
ncbi:uncharacterized protein KY384_004922 [Bacidia gigantensis]|uniref:uncharacterized protein n=1 Tax=Bacidia gigantensis TaxID=2732470 RepID=UPI001D04A4E0|nr:uncharacterized protein KY384_004922 [Bacidia gigantensis]KAG8530420.1 hypothetical protein KY384_004922 [Bacidia gigantensis]